MAKEAENDEDNQVSAQAEKRTRVGGRPAIGWGVAPRSLSEMMEGASG